MISQLFILSSRGETLINRDLRLNLPKNTPEIFFRQAKIKNASYSPIFNKDGINYFHIKREGLYIVCTTSLNSSPCTILTLLIKLYTIIYDLCNIFNENSIRTNLIRIYEIIDEVLDFGIVQFCQTEQVYIFELIFRLKIMLNPQIKKI